MRRLGVNRTEVLSSMAIGTESDCVFNCVITTVRKWNLVVDLEIWAFIAATLPRHLRRVPTIAANHHEKMDGTGYPRGLMAQQMSAEARMMAIADVFEALTADDRPYKKGKTLSEALAIMAQMVRGRHLDPELYRLFLTAGVCMDYARSALHPEQIDVEDVGPYLP